MSKLCVVCFAIKHHAVQLNEVLNLVIGLIF